MAEKRYLSNKRIGFFIAAASAVPLGFMYRQFTDAPLLSSILGVFLAAFAFICVLSDCRKREALIVLCAFVVKLLLTAYQAYYKNLPLGGEDWSNFHTGAQALIADYADIPQILFSNTKDLFTKLVAVIYRIFGVHTRQINLYVLASSFVAARYVFRASMAVTGDDYKASSRAMLLFLIWPIDIVYSVTYLREMPVQMLVIVSFCCFIEYTQQRKLTKLIKSLAAIVLACMMHSGVVALLFVYIIFVRVKDGERPLRALAPANLIVAAIIIALLVISPIWDSVSAKLGNISSAEELVTRSQQFIEGEANTRYISDMPENIGEFILQVPYRTLLFAFVPLPWMVFSLNTGIAWAIDALPQVWLLFRLARTWRMSRQNASVRLYTAIGSLCLIGTYIVCAMGTTAYGNAIRHRAKILPVVLVLTVAAYRHLKDGTVKRDV